MLRTTSRCRPHRLGRGARDDGTDAPEHAADAAAHRAPPPEQRRPLRPGTQRSFTLWARRGVAAIGLAMRMMNVFWWRPTTDRPGYLGYRLWGDAFYYHHQANALADGKFFINPIRYVLRRGRGGERRPPTALLHLSRALVVRRDRQRHRAPGGVGPARRRGHRAGRPGRPKDRRGRGRADRGRDRRGLSLHVDQRRHGHVGVDRGARRRARAVRRVRLRAHADARHACSSGSRAARRRSTRTEMLLLFPLLVLPLALLRPERATAANTCQARGRRLRSSAVLLIAPVGRRSTWCASTSPCSSAPASGNTLAYGSCDEVFYGEFIGYYATATPGRIRENVDESRARPGAARLRARLHRGSPSRVPLVVAARVGRIWGVFKPGQTRRSTGGSKAAGGYRRGSRCSAYYAMVPFAIGGVVAMRRRKITILPIVVPS